MSTRSVRLADIRLSWQRYPYRQFEIMTGPDWAYRLCDGRPYHPLARAWKNVFRTLQRRADALHQQALADERALKEQHDWARGRPEPKPFGFWPPFRYHHDCAVCGQGFIVDDRRVDVCSASCWKQYAKQRYRRPSRARPKAQAVCPVCHKAFVQSRKDARFCSTKCRVAAHRATKGP